MSRSQIARHHGGENEAETPVKIRNDARVVFPGFRKSLFLPSENKIFFSSILTFLYRFAAPFFPLWSVTSGDGRRRGGLPLPSHVGHRPVGRVVSSENLNHTVSPFCSLFLFFPLVSLWFHFCFCFFLSRHHQQAFFRPGSPYNLPITSNSLR